jgi:hypothetical protein
MDIHENNVITDDKKLNGLNFYRASQKRHSSRAV